MNRIKNLIALGAFSLLILGLPAIASAQWRDRDRDDDYNRGGGRNNNGRYNQLDGVIRNLENRAKRFEDQMDRQDNDNYGGYGRNNRRSDNLEELSDRFVNAAKRLDNEYDDRGDFNRSRDEAQRVIEIGSQISRALSRSRNDDYLYNEWNGIENDLRIIANAYGLSYNDGYNRNNRNNRGNGRNNGGGGGWRNNFPFPF